MGKLSNEEQIKLFDSFGAYLVAKMHIEAGQPFCHEAQVKIFKLNPESVEELIGLYLQKGFILCLEAQEKIFDLPPMTAEKIILSLLESNSEINEKLFPKILALPSGKMLLENYFLTSEVVFSRKAQIMLIQTPQLAWLARSFLQINKRRPERICEEMRTYARNHGWYVAPSSQT